MKRILLNESGTFYKIIIVFCAELSCAELSGTQPPHLNLPKSLSIRDLSSAVASPHQAGEAYSSEATVVALQPDEAVVDGDHVTSKFVGQRWRRHRRRGVGRGDPPL